MQETNFKTKQLELWVKHELERHFFIVAIKLTFIKEATLFAGFY